MRDQTSNEAVYVWVYRPDIEGRLYIKNFRGEPDPIPWTTAYNFRALAARLGIIVHFEEVQRR